MNRLKMCLLIQSTNTKINNNEAVAAATTTTTTITTSCCYMRNQSVVVSPLCGCWLPSRMATRPSEGTVVVWDKSPQDYGIPTWPVSLAVVCSGLLFFRIISSFVHSFVSFV